MSYHLAVAELLERAARKRPEKGAVFDGSKRISYGELYKDVQLLASSLAAQGIEKGDRIIVYMPNWHEFVTVYFAVAKLGAIIVPANIRYRREELQYILEHSGAKAVFAGKGLSHFDFLEEFRRDPATELEHIFTVRFKKDPYLSYEALLAEGDLSKVPQTVINPEEDTISILYTSGTTGQPKGAMLTHKNFVHTAVISAEYMHCTKDDVFLIAVPAFHCFGMIPGILSAVAVAGKIVLVEEFKAEKVLQLIEEEKITVHHGVPTMFILELNHPSFAKYDLSSLRTGIIAGAPCPVEIVRRIRTEMGCDIVVSYGMTESSTTITMTDYDDDDFLRSETVGRPLPGAAVKIVDENRHEVPPGVVGEIAVKSYGIMKGYYRNPEKTKEVFDEEGWFYTGDLGTVDERGYVRIKGRKKEMIIRGGYNIYPREIEDHLYKHPSVMDTAIVGLPDTVLGEISCAAVKLKPGKKEDEQSIKEYLAQRVADYKVPDHVVFIEEFPMTASGKIKKTLLQQLLKEKLRGVLR